MSETSWMQNVNCLKNTTTKEYYQVVFTRKPRKIIPCNIICATIKKQRQTIWSRYSNKIVFMWLAQNPCREKTIYPRAKMKKTGSNLSKKNHDCVTQLYIQYYGLVVIALAVFKKQ